MITLIAAAFLASHAGKETTIDVVLPQGLKDITLIARVVSGDQHELRKINKDFGLSYQFKESKISIKLPMKFRAETKIEDSNILYVIDGDELLTSFAGLRSHQNLKGKPGRRQSGVEIGLLTPDLFEGYLTAKYVREASTDKVPVFDLSYVASDGDKTRNRVWVDGDHRYVTRREWFNREGKHVASFTYSAPINVSGVWVPTHMEVSNGEGKLAGVTDYVDIKVNTGLSDSIFATK
ncbi:MAG: outer membrane lipoprotein-sorting protein [Fimbriimonas sp.]|nr:outer membrane lipoprotein-sorting protein [Fimbriimonas sp.]